MTVFFAHLESSSVIAAIKILTKSTPGFSFVRAVRNGGHQIKIPNVNIARSTPLLHIFSLSHSPSHFLTISFSHYFSLLLSLSPSPSLYLSLILSLYNTPSSTPTSTPSPSSSHSISLTLSLSLFLFLTILLVPLFKMDRVRIFGLKNVRRSSVYVFHCFHFINMDNVCVCV